MIRARVSILRRLRATSRRPKFSSSSGTLTKQREQEGLGHPKDELPPQIQQQRQQRQDPSFVKRKSKRSNEEVNPEDLETANEFLHAAQSRQKELHNVPIGSFTQQDWTDAHNLMEYLCQGRGKNPPVPSTALNQTVPWTLEMLDRLVQEQRSSASKFKSYRLHPDWLKRITQNWRQNYQKQASKKKKVPDIIDPTSFIDQVERLARESQGQFILNTWIYTTVMGVAFRIAIKKNKAQRAPRQQSSTARSSRGLVATEEMVTTAEFMESLLNQMNTVHVKPDRFAYILAIQAWEWACDGIRARRILQNLCDLYDQGDHKLQPNRDCFQSVLQAFARGPKTADTVDQCAQLIQQMQDFHMKKALDTLPQAAAFNTLLTCMVHSTKDCLAQAEQLVKEELPAELVDVHTYDVLLEMYSKRGMDQKARRLLGEMIEKYHETGDTRLAPKTKSFNLVLSAATKAGNYRESEALFRMMEDLHANNVLRGVAPDQYTYSILLDCWANQVGRVPDATARVDAIFHTMKRLAEQGSRSVRATNVTYTTVINAFAKAGDAKRAEELLGEMMDAYEHTHLQDLLPDRPAFNTVLLALSRSDRHDAARRIRALMQRMEETSTNDRDIQPDVRSYNSLLQAIARSGQKDAGEQCERIMLKKMCPHTRLAPNTISFMIVVQAYQKAGKAENAERILEHVVDEYCKRANTNAKPSVHLFSAVMNAWSKCRTANAPERAAALLDRMKTLAAAGDLWGSIDTTVYNILLDAWSNSGRDDAGERAQAILQEMEDGVIDGVNPTTISYNTCLKAWSVLGDTDSSEKLFIRILERRGIQPGYETLCTLLTAWARSPEFESDDDRAEAVLKKLNEVQKESGIAANVACYNVVLDCLSKSKTVESCSAAEELLYEMERLAEQTTGENSWVIRPNRISYTSVIHAFANIGDAEKCEEILDRLIAESIRSNDRRLHPTTKTFNTVLKGYARKCRQTPSPDVPPRAETLLRRMRRTHKAAGIPVKPDVISYNTLMDIWANSQRPKSSKRTLEILEDMIKSRNEDTAPTTHSYNIAINAFAQSGQYEKAEWLLHSMYEAYNQKLALRGHSAAKPNLITWNSLLSVYANSHNPGERAEGAIQKMEELYKDGVLEARPDTVSFNCLMHSLAQSSGSDAGVRCEAIIEEMETRWFAGDEYVKPDARSFGAAIQAWLKHHNFEAARALFDKMFNAYAEGDESMKPSLTTILRLLQFSSPNAAEEIRERMKSIYPDALEVEVLAGHEDVAEVPHSATTCR